MESIDPKGLDLSAFVHPVHPVHPVYPGSSGSAEA
jgi:hypothetical protein